jgi:hypothetical protein
MTEQEVKMKLLTALVLIVALAFPCAAADFAIDKGSWILGGGVGFEIQGGDRYENADGDKVTMISFDPFAGYFLMPGLVAGAQVIFDSETQGDVKDTAYGIGPMVGYYMGGPYATMYPFASVRFNYVKHKDEYPDPIGTGTVENKWGGTSLGFSVGATKMLCRNVGVRLALFYAIDSYKPDEGDSVDGNRMGLRVGLESFIW